MKHEDLLYWLHIICLGLFLALLNFCLMEYHSGLYMSRSLTGLETACYGFLGGLNLLVVCRFAQKGSRKPLRVLLNVGVSALFVVQVILINNLFNYVKFNSAFYWTDSITPYSHFLIEDITYKIGIGKYRYLLAFLAFFAAVSLAGIVRPSKSDDRQRSL